MSEFKSLDDVIGYLTNVAEFELRHTEHIKIPDGHMTVISENYNIMFDAIQWITEKLEQPQLNENQHIVLEQLCLIYTKQIYKSSLQAIYIFIKNGMSDAYLNLDRNEASQVLEVFSRWAQKQEEEQ